MKLSLLLLVAGLYNLSASVYSQSAKLDLSLHNVTLKEAFDNIEKISDYKFLYRSDLVDINSLTSINVERSSLADILAKLFANKEISYNILNDNLVVLTPLQKQKLTGLVTDANTGEPLPGVNITVEGTTVGATTDESGKYSLELPSVNPVIIFSFVGYTSERFELKGQELVNISLQPDVTKLEEVVVVGYGTQRKADLTGSVASIKGDELTKSNTGNVSTAIAGRLPGVQVTQSSGEPGATAVLKVRGVGSVNSGNAPLVLIDGFEGNLGLIDPADIESMTVLKDAASASIYGSRAANGVILITTKRGKKQDLKLEFNATTGSQSATNIPAILGSEDWCNKSNATYMVYNGSIPWPTSNAELDPSKQKYSTNWLDYIFRNAPTQNYHISASGGSDKFQYSINGGYFNQDGIIFGENYKRANVRANLDYVGKNFTMGVKLSEFRSWNKSTIQRSTIMNDAFRTPPTIPISNPDGSVGTPRANAPGEDVLQQDNTPAMDVLAYNNLANTNSSTANIYAEVNLFKGLKFKSVFNVTFQDGLSEVFKNTWFAYRPTDTDHSGSTVRQEAVAKLTNTDNTSYTWESQNLLTYTIDFNEHHIDALAGMSSQKWQSNVFWASKEGFSRNTLKALDAGEGSPLGGGEPGKSSLASYFGRVNYSFKGKYLLQGNIRRDGSSNFAPGNRWGVFPSASAGWRISEENFLKNNKVISNLKLKAGYGTLGNQNIPAYQWLGIIDFASYPFGQNPQVENPSAQVNAAYNTAIKWEKTTITNVAVDLGLFNNKVNITAEFFDKKTTDMLLVQPLPLSSGVWGNPYVNIGAVDNKGWEFVFEFNNNINKLNYGASFNITHVMNKVTDMGGIPPIVNDGYRTMKGESINSYYGFEVDGFWQNQEEINALPVNSKNKSIGSGAHPGDYRFKDLNNDTIIDDKDRKVIGNSIPQYYYGANIYLNWKGFDLSVFFQGEFNKKILITPTYGLDFGAGYPYSNMFKEVYDKRWQKEDDNTYYPALGSGYHANQSKANTRWVQDASYLRVKSMQLGYTLPKQFTSKFNIAQLKVFTTMTNWFTFTKYPGFDPEMDKVLTNGGAEYPQAKTITLGINMVL